MKVKKIIYLDNAANTPVSKKVFKAMKKYLQPAAVGNSLGLHRCGINNFLAIDKARSDVASLLGAYPEEVFFTSGATESNNTVIKGLALNELAKPEDARKNRIIVSCLEHSSVLEACKDLSKLGFEIKKIPCDMNGVVKATTLKKYLNSKTLLVCIMAVNNETGTVNNVDYLAKMAHNFKAHFLSDCTQRISVGSARLCTEYPNVDYITFSGHKINGPEGVGCIVKRGKAPLYRLIAGGSQEGGIRGGTHNVAGIVGLAAALKERVDFSVAHPIFYADLFDQLITGIDRLNKKFGSNIIINGVPNYGNIVNINLHCLGDIDAITILLSEDIACSAGAACEVNSSKPKPSHVLSCMGLSEEEINSSVRISFDHYTKSKEVRIFLKKLEKIIREYSERNDYEKSYCF